VKRRCRSIGESVKAAHVVSLFVKGFATLGAVCLVSAVSRPVVAVAAEEPFESSHCLHVTLSESSSTSSASATVLGDLEMCVNGSPCSVRFSVYLASACLDALAHMALFPGMGFVVQRLSLACFLMFRQYVL
jgi:hypothetical protein